MTDLTPWERSAIEVLLDSGPRGLGPSQRWFAQGCKGLARKDLAIITGFDVSLTPAGIAEGNRRRARRAA